MSKLQQIENIKIPYATEGVIRTAALDDTIAPEDSVQLAVNMNFDRVGAIQTRLGVTNYADSLQESVKNFGKLRNSIRPDGYENINQLGILGEFTSFATFISSVKIDATRLLVTWSGTDGDGFAQVFETNLLTGGLVPLGTAFEFDVSSALYIKASRVDNDNYLVVWSGPGFDGFAQVLRVNSSTWAVTAISTALEFDTAAGLFFSVAQIDANHFVVFYSNNTNGIATTLEINLSTFAVTKPGSSFTFQLGRTVNIECIPLGDGTRVLTLWVSAGVSKAQVFLVNTTTWNITAVGTSLTLSAGSKYFSLESIGDIEHFLCFFADNSNDGTAQVLNVNTTTYQVTTIGTPVVFDNTSVFINSSVSMGTGEDFVNFWKDGSGDTYSQIFSVDPITFAVTAVGRKLFVSTGEVSFNSLDSVAMNSFLIIGLWPTVSESGNGAAFVTKSNTINQRFLYAADTTQVRNWDGTSWVVRRSGLAQVSKPRFAQYLNYIWMVNGNDRIGGDPVATSSGGAFGADLVPENFPKGDFIHAGFEGRVWVIDKSLGVIHYTDIVQFAPPNVYTLTYDPAVNFISNLSPQTGQSFTALYRVPRALLVFTEDTIFRIYGATSIDAYPAYNVGTFSQESIIESKTGIFFHHSSGFYQFDYGGQPVEISRRIIDFVKAIPRAAYGDIKGVYDGFDAVEWAVGPVTVEGVVFSNCVLRYTLSTQVWTVYDYTGNVITAMVSYDNGTAINHLIGTSTGLVGALDTGKTDFGVPFYYEYIDRWRSFTDMYYKTKALDGVNLYSENAAGANISYQIQKSGPNVWKHLATVDERNNAFFPTEGTDDFDVLRLRVAGNTKGEQVVIHGMEIPSLTIKGQETN